MEKIFPYLKELTKECVTPQNSSPLILYKYRSLTAGLSILNGLQIWMSSAAKFSDREDCAFKFHYELMREEDYILKAFNYEKELHPEYTDRMLIEQANIKGHEKFEQYKSHEEVNKLNANWKRLAENQFAIFSSSTDNRSLRMWKDYAEEFSGVCIGFDPNELMKAHCGQIFTVFYYTSYPTIVPELEKHGHPGSLYATLLLKNKLLYEYEQEFRVFKTLPAGFRDKKTMGIVLPIHDACIKEIIIGHLASDMSELVIVLKKQFPLAKIFTTSISTGKVELQSL